MAQYLSNEVLLPTIVDKTHNQIQDNVDVVIGDKLLSLPEKNSAIDKIFSYELCTLAISELTVTKLLQFKEETTSFLELFSNMVNFASARGIAIFGYQHLYQLILQQWMDPPKKVLTVNFRKKIISLGFGSATLPRTIINLIKDNINVWFCNLGVNADVTELIEWLCIFDTSGEILHHKKLFEQSIKQSVDKKKAFRKMHNMTTEEYDVHQQAVKIEGLCKYIRENLACPHGVKCNFYHGKIVETYGIQPCRYNDRCQHLPKGDCKFVHDPNKQQLANTKAFYLAIKTDASSFLVDLSKTKYVDNQCYNNPFVILQKNEFDGRNVHYSIPVCNCVVTDEFGVEHKCSKPVLFMSKKNGKISNFYCCYEHMNVNEAGCIYVVKQNVLDKILD